jgi:hypothetical protein
LISGGLSKEGWLTLQVGLRPERMRSVRCATTAAAMEWLCDAAAVGLGGACGFRGDSLREGCECCAVARL